MLQFWQILISFEKCFLVILAKKIDCKQKTPARNEPGLNCLMDSIGDSLLQNDTGARERPTVNYACL